MIELWAVSGWCSANWDMPTPTRGLSRAIWMAAAQSSSRRSLDSSASEPLRPPSSRIGIPATSAQHQPGPPQPAQQVHAQHRHEGQLPAARLGEDVGRRHHDQGERRQQQAGHRAAQLEQGEGEGDGHAAHQGQLVGVLHDAPVAHPLIDRGGAQQAHVLAQQVVAVVFRATLLAGLAGGRRSGTIAS